MKLKLVIIHEHYAKAILERPQQNFIYVYYGTVFEKDHHLNSGITVVKRIVIRPQESVRSWLV